MWPFGLRFLGQFVLASTTFLCLSAAEDPAETESPPRLKWTVEVRGRFEAPAGIDFEDGHHERFYLSRFRLSIEGKANNWFRFYLQGQDARALGVDSHADLDSVAHRFDFHQAFADFGRTDGSWGVRAGRQELAFGDERLLGADSCWDPLGITFDAARITYRRPHLRVDAFSAFVLMPEYEHMARPSTGNRLYGVYVSLGGRRGGALVEPYFIWNQRTRVAPAADVYTAGIRTAGKLPKRFDYNVEVAVQRGHRAQAAIRAWAGHWEMGQRLCSADRCPRLSVEYNFASGDERPDDGRYSTFDDLYPAGYNKYGMADPFAWRNIRNIAGGLEFSLSKRWTLAAAYRSFWLADTHDRLYTKGEEFLAWNPGCTDRHAGNQILLLLAHDFSDHLRIAAGEGRFFPGKYLVNSGLRAGYNTPYVDVNYRF